jgi:plastocyanin
MKSKSLLLSALLVLSFESYATTWTIVNSGFTFSPASITINAGDSVLFTIASQHNVREVDQSTWNSNGSMAAIGGFSAPNGGGLILPSKLGVGSHWYVCVPHASMGMKGVIIVNPATGISEALAGTKITLSPNPTNDIVKIAASEDFVGMKYIVSDNNGKQIISGQLTPNETIVDLGKFAAGYYFIQIGDEKKNSYKIIRK